MSSTRLLAVVLLIGASMQTSTVEAQRSKAPPREAPAQRSDSATKTSVSIQLSPELAMHLDSLVLAATTGLRAQQKPTEDKGGFVATASGWVALVAGVLGIVVTIIGMIGKGRKTDGADVMQAVSLVGGLLMLVGVAALLLWFASAIASLFIGAAAIVLVMEIGLLTFVAFAVNWRPIEHSMREWGWLKEKG